METLLALVVALDSFLNKIIKRDLIPLFICKNFQQEKVCDFFLKLKLIDNDNHYQLAEKFVKLFTS